MGHTAVLDGALGDRYVSEFYGLRPEVLMMLYVERGLWERFLARHGEASTGQAGAARDVRATGCVGTDQRAAKRCGYAPAVALLGRRARHDAP
jgi:hypothetical protein